MLRFFVLLLVLVNGLYFAWSQGLLRGYGFAPALTSEPQRLQQQIRPQAILILSAPQAASAQLAANTPPKPPECLQAGVFDEQQAGELRQTIEAALPAGSWSMDTVLSPARWIVYMGKYPSAEALAKKRSELRGLNLKFEPLTNPELEPGLSLGGFETQTAAQTALTALGRRGVRTARVVLEQAQVKGSVLRIAAADEALRARLDEFKPALAGKSWLACQ